MRQIIRSVLAVLAGFVVSVLIGFAVGRAKGALIQGPVHVPGAPLAPMGTANFVGELILYGLVGLGGGYAVARLAPRARVGHACVLALVTVGLTVNDFRNPMPAGLRWQVATAGLLGALLCALAGVAANARLQRKQLARPRQQAHVA
ncbi:MAG: hypothetical protein ACRENP_22125 [Longimicrobiales bacterium]